MKKTLLALALLLGTSGVFAQIGIKTDALNTQKKADLKAEISQRIKSQNKAAFNMSKDETRELICDFSDPSTYTFGKTTANGITDDIWQQTDTTSGFGGSMIDQFLGISDNGWFIFWPTWAGEGTYYNLSAANGFAYVDMLDLYSQNLNTYQLDGYIKVTAPLVTYGTRGVDIYFNQVLQRFNQERYFIDWSNDENFTTYDSIEFNVRGIEMNANEFDYGVKKVTLPNGTLNANAVGQTPDEFTYIRIRLYSPSTPAQPHGYFWIVDDIYYSEIPENRVDLVSREYYGGGYHLLPQGIVPDTLVYNVTLENTGATDYNDVVLSTELYSVTAGENEGDPDIYTLVEGWGNISEADTLANTTYTGIYSINGSDTVWTAMRTRDMKAYSTSIPSLPNVGTYALASKLSSAGTGFTQSIDDTTYFNVVGPMVVPEGHYQWTKDRNVLVERRDFRYGYVEEGGNVYLTDEAAYTSEGYEVCVAFSASLNPTTDKYINGVEVVPSLDSCAPGVVIQGKLRKFDYNAESWDAAIVDVEDEFGNPVESAPYTVQQSDLNNGLCTDPDYLDVIGADQFKTIYMPFPYGVKIEGGETYYACYRLLTTGKFSVGTDDPQLNTFGPGALNQTALLVFTPGLSEAANFAWGGRIYPSSGCDYRTPLIRLLVSETAGVKDDVADLTSSFNAYPNPASNNATISYTLNKSGNVRIVVTDIMGREVMNMNQGSQVAGGTYTVNMNTANLSNGTYFYTLSVNGERQTKKLVINK